MLKPSSWLPKPPYIHPTHVTSLLSSAFRQKGISAVLWPCPLPSGSFHHRFGPFSPGGGRARKSSCSSSMGLGNVMCTVCWEVCPYAFRTFSLWPYARPVTSAKIPTGKHHRPYDDTGPGLNPVPPIVPRPHALSLPCPAGIYVCAIAALWCSNLCTALSATMRSWIL